MRALAVVAIALGLAGCPAPRPAPTIPTTPTRPLPRPQAPATVISVTHVGSLDEVPRGAPPAGTWRLHLIDVGTGLAILIQGADFTLLFDAGTNDKAERPERILAYIAAALGATGDGCGAQLHIDQVVLSHPHLDHASALADVLHCYDVANLWDSGAVNDTAFYRDVMEQVARSTALAYHTAAPPPTDRTVMFKKGAVVIPSTVAWNTFSEGDTVALGAGASFELLHAEGKKHPDFNQNSIVIAVTLGTAKVLLVGDAESGDRADPSMPCGDVEEHLIDHFKAEIRADVLQVGHHGSKTSSRSGFLQAVAPKYALVSAGPKMYGSVVLPDAEVIEALKAVGAEVLRTDEHDGAGCPDGPGGCDNYVLTFAPAAR